MNTIKLAQALLRRKELQEKVQRIDRIRTADLFEVKARRVRVTDSTDDLTAEVPKLELNQVTKEYDYYSKQLRQIDAVIQQANWTTDIEVEDNNMKDFNEQ